MKNQKRVRIFHRSSNSLLAEGRVGWGITPFEGNYYISKNFLKTNNFKSNFFPGICFYKFFFVWLDYVAPDGNVSKFLGWKYWLPNPLFPFIWFRVAVPIEHPDIRIEEYFT